MKRKIVLIILCILFVFGFFYLQFSREPTVDSFITRTDSTGYDATMTITVNKLVIFNRDKIKESLKNHILNNDFGNMQFSYDLMGYPKEIVVTVYTNNFTKKLGIPAFHFKYAYDN